MANIAIIGAGQLGSRHLQALASLAGELNIQVLDASADALRTARSRFEEVAAGFRGRISYHEDISGLSSNIDVAVIATGSAVRRKVTEALLAACSVRYLILEKFLFTSGEDYHAVSRLLKEKNVSAWVNCPRRMMDIYKNIRKEIKGPLHFTASGNNWGLGCNGIHLLDLFAYLSAENGLQLSSSLIDRKIHESKRPGYIEFTGSVRGTAGMSSCLITSFDAAPSGMQVVINTATAKYSIMEGASGKAWISRQQNNWEWEELPFSMPFQSQLTDKVVAGLLENGSCSLTPYEESAALHLAYLGCLLEVVREVRNDSTISECPVT